MRRNERLTRKRDFERVRREGRSGANSLLVLQAVANGLDVSRFGFVVGKRLGGAVARNRVKRRLREAIRLEKFPPGWDIVVIGRRPVVTASFEEICAELRALRRRTDVNGGAR